MRQIELNNEAERFAQWYSRLLRKYVRGDAIRNIIALISEFNSYHTVELVDSRGNHISWLPPQTIVNYLRTLLKRYDALKTMHPKKYIQEINRFEGIIQRDWINKKMKIDSSSSASTSLASKIIKGMQYDVVRQKIYPSISRALGIKTCVYCNANFTISASDGNGYYDLDHWKPKSLYPYLCTSFFNLQPCCPSCNKRKSNDDEDFFHIWDDCNRKYHSILGVNLTKKSIVLYKTTFDASILVPKFYTIRNKYSKMRDVMQNKLHIEERYKEHLDVAEEIIWKSMAYNPSMIKALRKSFNTAVPNNAEINRFILGTYDKPEDVHKRPLTVFRQNIARQLGLLK